MYLPMQSEPVHRTIVGQVSIHAPVRPGPDANTVPPRYGVGPSEYGVQPNGWQDWVKTIGGGILDLL